jgi:hypothetical protein
MLPVTMADLPLNLVTASCAIAFSSGHPQSPHRDPRQVILEASGKRPH